MKYIMGCMILVLLSGSFALAQLPTATILGQVKDSSGAFVPEAKVTVRNSDTGQTRTAISGSEDGSYRFDALLVGNYEITVEKSGFKTSTQSGLTLTVAQQAVENFSLEVGETSQTVSVTGEAPLVNTTTSSLGGLVDEKRMADLPLNGRNYANLTLLEPGITKSVSAPSNAFIFSGTQYSSNGSPIRSNAYLLDGALLTNALSTNGASVVGDTLGVDGILEYRVITNNFPAEYGMSMGSQMLLVSKGGTNKFHGDAFEFLRNSVLDARNFFDLPPSVIGHRLPEFRRNNFGGALGGPVKKDKTFFFGVYEQLSQALGTTNTTNVLQAGCHGAAGAVITLAACPQLSPTASVTIASVVAPWVALYPLPNVGTSQFGFGFTQPTADHYGQIRVDQIISSSDSLFARYTVDDATTSSAFDFPNSFQVLSGRNQFFTLSESHVFSTALLNTARFSFSRNNQGFSTPVAYSGPQYEYIPNLEPGTLITGGLTSIGSNTTGPRIYKMNIFTWSDDVNYTRGRHSLKFGALLNHFQEYLYGGDQLKGSLTFGSVATFLTGQLSGVSISAPGSITWRTYHFNTMGFYAQDDWRVTSRLTLNLGLRYEPTTTYEEVNGISASLRNLATDAAPTVGPPFKNNSLRNWSPRFGFAWDVTGNGRTAVRGGFAELYDLTTYGLSLITQAGAAAPFATGITLTNVPFTVPFVFPPSTPGVQTYKGIPYFTPQPHMLQYNLVVERQLPGSMALTVAYAGSRGLHLVNVKEGNPTIPNGIPVNGACVTPPAGTTINLANQVDGSATSCWLPGATRINPNFGSILLTPYAGDSFYNSLQVGLNKRMSRGLQFQVSYTWSKLIDDTQGTGGSDFTPQVGNNAIGQDALHYQRTDRGPADFDVTNNLRLNVIYHFPVAGSFSGLRDKLLNGWWTSGILSLQSGYPFSVFTTGTNRSLSGDVVGFGVTGIDRPDVVGGSVTSNITHGVSAGCGSGATRAAGGTAIAAGTPLGTPSLFYDPCVFSIQPLGFLGDEGRNLLRGPGLGNLDLSLVKDTAVRFLGEGGNIQFRTEVFNVSNHTNFGQPASTVYAGTASVQNPPSAAGVISSTLTNSRQIQFGLKIMF